MRSKIVLKFNKETSKEPITYNLIKRHNIKINILKATIDSSLKGELLLEIEGQSKVIAQSIEYLESHGVDVAFFYQGVEVNDSCISCGFCTGLCSINALKLNDNQQLVYDSQKCIGCLGCIENCPVSAISKIR